MERSGIGGGDSYFINVCSNWRCRCQFILHESLFFEIFIVLKL